MSWSLEEALAYYKSQGAPGDQNAVVGLLREVQQERGGRIPAQMLEPIAKAWGLKESFLLALIRRLPSLRLADTHCLEICGGRNCGKRAALAAFAEANPGNYSVKYMPCMRVCGKGPNIRWDGRLYHQADEALLRRLIQEAE